MSFFVTHTTYGMCFTSCATKILAIPIWCNQEAKMSPLSVNNTPLSPSSLKSTELKFFLAQHESCCMTHTLNRIYEQTILKTILL